jgi:GNAT superfamily N-acetyltransferase
MLKLSLRLAALGDVEAIARLIEVSVRVLQVADYAPEQIEAAVGTVFGLDRQLIQDQTYYLVESDGRLAACGGWSRRRTLFGTDAAAVRDDTLLTPGVDAARIRAFFVHPDFARQGVGGLLLSACESEARANGYLTAELGATLTGVPLYARRGYREIERIETPLPGGLRLPVVRMTKVLGEEPRAADCEAAPAVGGRPDAASGASGA